MKKTITRETTSRLLKDLKQIIQNPLTTNGIYYLHDDEDILKGYAMIVGSSETPYFGGFYFFKFDFPTDYPHSPPIVTYCTNGDNIRFNPNLYKSGKVCVSLLNTWRGEQWTSCQTISTILLTLCTLLCKDPILNEPGIVRSHPDFEKYTRIIEYKNVEIAIIQMLEKKSGVFMDEFNVFYSFLKEEFLKNKSQILLQLQKKTEEYPKNEVIVTMLYSMNVNIDYPTLVKNFQKIEI